MTATGIEIIYDGECPFCSSYVAMVRLRDAAGPVELIDARSDDPRVAAALAAGYDLDAGMIVNRAGRTLHGHEAVHLIAVLSSGGGIFNAAQRALFRSPRVAAALYPVLAFGRRVFLRLIGRGLIGDARRQAATSD